MVIDNDDINNKEAWKTVKYTAPPKNTQILLRFKFDEYGGNYAVGSLDVYSEKDLEDNPELKDNQDTIVLDGMFCRFCVEYPSCFVLGGESIVTIVDKEVKKDISDRAQTYFSQTPTHWKYIE